MRLVPVCLVLCLLFAAPAALAQDDSLFTSLQNKGQPTARPGNPTTARIVEGLSKRRNGATPSQPKNARLTNSKGQPTGSLRGDESGMKAYDATGRVTGRVQSDARGAGRLMDASGRFAGRTQPDGKGGYRLFDATGRHTRTLTPDGRGGYRVFDPQGRFLGRVDIK